jgi:hypothetical protein
LHWIIWTFQKKTLKRWKAKRKAVRLSKRST